MAPYPVQTPLGTQYQYMPVQIDEAVQKDRRFDRRKILPRYFFRPVEDHLPGYRQTENPDRRDRVPSSLGRVLPDRAGRDRVALPRVILTSDLVPTLPDMFAGQTS